MKNDPALGCGLLIVALVLVLALALGTLLGWFLSTMT